MILTPPASEKCCPKKIPSTFPRPLTEALDWMSERIYYVKGDFVDPEAYKRLDQQINEADKPPQHSGQPILLSGSGSALLFAHRTDAGPVLSDKEESGHWARVIIEKPFGHDLESAKKLNQE